MDKTALQMLIDRMKKAQDKCDSLTNKLTCQIFIEKAESLLDKERQQIEEAFNDGFYGVGNTGSTYYQSKYTESK